MSDISNAKANILSRAKALGNTNYGLKEVCSDLVNKHCGGDPKAIKEMSSGTFLGVSTLERMAALADAKSGSTYKPQADTCERILRYMGAEITFNQVTISEKYRNKEKD